MKLDRISRMTKMIGLILLWQRVQVSDASSNVRASKQRIPPFQRIYGKENTAVRDEIHKIETESTHYRRTGLHADPDFFRLDDDGNTRRRTQEVVFGENSFQPMRITMVTDHLQTRRSDATKDQIDFITGTILPRMSAFWSETLNVLPVGTREGDPDMPLRIDKTALYNQLYCGDPEFTKVPTEHFTDGVADTDLILYVSGEPSARFCGPSTLAVAVACNFDEYDRPTAGAINFCLDQIDLDGNGSAHETIIEDNVDVAIHEAAHVLGMSSNSFKYFRDPDTMVPRTSRPLQASTVTCVDGTTKTETMPDENTLRLLVGENGQRYATIVTPKVQAVARNQFNCFDLEGAQLENQPTGSSCSGDHWDERLFYPESMSGVISPTTVILSPLTLALFEDSGWYAANYKNSKVSPWGHGAGCDFVRKPCLTKGTDTTTVPDYGRGYFCTKSDQRGCSPSQFYKMGCTLLDYALYTSSPNPPPQFQYFDKATSGGPSQADYCPLYGSVYRSNAHELDCRDENNADVLGFYGEQYGGDSMCFESTSGTGRCYEHRCNIETRKLYVYVNDNWEECAEDFAQITISVDWQDASRGTTITCPRLTSACPDMFCPVNCAGRGDCNWDFVNENGTTAPKCECYNSSDTTSSCSETQPLGDKYVNSDDLINRLRKKFFDPLIAIFTDNPDEWETESWIWASALLVLFLLMMMCICSTFWPKKKKDDYNNKRRARSDDYRGSPTRGSPQRRRTTNDYEEQYASRQRRGNQYG